MLGERLLDIWLHFTHKVLWRQQELGWNEGQLTALDTATQVKRPDHSTLGLSGALAVCLATAEVKHREQVLKLGIVLA